MVKIEELEKQLKEGKLANLYLLYGEETYLMENACKKIKTTFGEMVKGINAVFLEESNMGELIPNIQTPAFGYEKKLIYVKNSGLFKKETKKKNSNIKQMQEKLTYFLKENWESIKESVILIFCEEEIEKNALYQEIEKQRRNHLSF